ncbi:hypothetical protein COLO4_03952 [Corchorus olitorius]|uniref:Uncharacterized protein n=1 Tax=Corchorus olitorius TaxID=93759 RepID=A0A1R3KW09_9ROSI|nr:hypothetical protein COLO4_03952 [Corchorus olitorius]
MAEMKAARVPGGGCGCEQWSTVVFMVVVGF